MCNNEYRSGAAGHPGRAAAARQRQWRIARLDSSNDADALALTFAERVAPVNMDEIPLPVWGGGLFVEGDGWMV